MKPINNGFAYSAIAAALFMSMSSAHAEQEQQPTENDIEVVEVIGSVSRFGATKSNTPIVETSRSVSIESLKDALEKGSLNLSQMVTYLPGVTGETFGFATRSDNITIRGLRAPRYRDSIQEQFGNYNAPRTEIFTLEQVEVLRGPASVLYGQGSPGGIVNYVSKTPRSENFGQVNAQVGNFDRRQLGVDINRVLNDDASLQGRFVGVYRDSGTQIEQVNDDTLVLMPSLTFMPSEETSLTFIGLYQDSDVDTAAQFIPVQGTLTPLADGSFLNSNVYAGESDFNKLETKSTQITVLLEHEINNDFTLHGTALWRDGEGDYHQAWPTFNPTLRGRYLNELLVQNGVVPPGVPTGFTDTTVARTFHQADNEFKQYALDLRLSGEIDTGNLSHEILVGAQYQDVETDSNFSRLTGGGVLQGDFRYILDLANPVYTGAPEQAVFDAIYQDRPTNLVEDIGIYLSDQISIDNWRITLGARYDQVDNKTRSDIGNAAENVANDDSALSLSGGVLYQFDNGLSPYINYSESFETVVGLTDTGAQLDPQEAEQIEFGAKYEPNNFPGLFTLAYFEIDINNLPDPNALPGQQGQQNGEATLKGFEFEGRFTLGEFNFQLAYTDLDTEDQDGLQLSAIPDTSASAWVVWQPEELLPGFRVGTGVRHVGESVSAINNGIATALRLSPFEYVTPDYTLVDLLIGYSFNENFDIALNVRNLADKDYQTGCLFRGDCFPGVRRTVNASITYSF
ncbi:TonB-dependent siderophore receptor [Endozoicomonas sp. G2_1]|uniref:TonB-dependent siderophore receptor n=1 Tax=Endozoicomonas sp. G2_1 TaxID=2821091 RepID=UPI001AD988FA|nr:TonB-dependent siderophore receptor [Endozoicomonas sp. G2_1]MBO9489144.1 TonB-dependent siderophore receptor [Endozoicomonas sp. G2_1]